MPSGQPLRGQARRTRIEMNGRHDAVTAEFGAHVKICAVCARAGKDVFKRCDEGWALAKAELRTKRAIERHGENHPDNQLELF